MLALLLYNSHYYALVNTSAIMHCLSRLCCVLYCWTSVELAQGRFTLTTSVRRQGLVVSTNNGNIQVITTGTYYVINCRFYLTSVSTTPLQTSICVVEVSAKCGYLWKSSAVNFKIKIHPFEAQVSRFQNFSSKTCVHQISDHHLQGFKTGK